jgi:hypothetical protein
MVSNSSSLQKKLTNHRQTNRYEITSHDRRSFRSLIESVSDTISNVTSGVRKGNTGLVLSGIAGLRHSPYPALVLGTAGLLPFAGTPALMMLFGPSSVAFLSNAQMVYGACILSFLGGVRWGFGTCEGKTTPAEWDNMRNFTISILPSLVAVCAILCPEPVSQILVMLGLTGVGCHDAVTASYPAWFRGLRMLLTVVAVSSFILTSSCKSRLRSTDSPKDKETSEKTESATQVSEKET